MSAKALKLFCVVSWIGLALAAEPISPRGGCTLNVHGNSPIFMKKFGHQKVIFEEKVGSMRVDEGDTIQAHCTTSISLQSTFSTSHDAESVRSKELQCFKNGRFRYKTLDERNFIEAEEGEMYISCNDKLQRFLYESEQTLPNCKNHMSYAIGILLPNVKDVISAGICYDLDTMDMKYVNYIAYRPRYELALPKQVTFNLNTVSLDKRLNKLDTYFSSKINTHNFETAVKFKKHTYPMLNHFDFDYGSLIQDSAMTKEFSEFENIVSIAWWRELRLGNWKAFLEALEKRTKLVNYLVYLGTFGETRVPTMQVNTGEVLSFEIEEARIEPPEYVWAYMTSLHSNVTEEFVLIAYNSPFHQEGNSSGATMFCPDMCDEIGWIKTSHFSKIRLMPTMGLIWCCRPEDAAQKFINFPMEGVRIVPNAIPAAAQKAPPKGPPPTMKA